jgi:predicted dehydrogenase
MNWLLGRPREVFARPVSRDGIGAPGHVLALVEYEYGEGIAEGSMMMPRSYRLSSRIRVLCEEGVAECVFRAAPAAGGGNIGAGPATRGLWLFRPETAPEFVPVESADPWDPEIAYFVECVERGRPPEQGTGEQARDALLVSLAVNRSCESGRPERV